MIAKECSCFALRRCRIRPVFPALSSGASTGTPSLQIQISKSKSSNPSLQKGNVMAKTNFRPLHDRVVVKRIDAEEKTKGGIIIPDSAKEKPQDGQVVAVGPGGRDEAGKLIPIDIKSGDRVLF